MAIVVTSTSFPPNGPIPKKHTGEGSDISPSLSWSGLPPETKEIAIICDDPDAPTPEPWVHWVLYKVPPVPNGIAEGSNGGGVEGRNSWSTIGWRGPMPPKGHGVHHYHFRVFALDAPVEYSPGITKNELLQRMRGHVLAEGELIGTYERRNE
ncbi:MAG TPA: YbhB/YbcL family Raf kinase inhibitor-like protein [Planctomycetota bacterium]|nr:YbhB/YbcL family Raf kinase inhibitor-like protein [Planctomycetota bacterium]